MERSRLFDRSTLSIPNSSKKKGGSRREDKHLIWNGQNYVLRLLNCSRNGLNKKLQIEKYFKIIK